MKNEFARMQKLAGLIVENTQSGDVWKATSPAMKIKLLKRLGVEDEATAKKYAETYKDKSWAEVKKAVSDLTINEIELEDVKKYGAYTSKGSIESTGLEDFISKMKKAGYSVTKTYTADDVKSSNPIFDFSWKIGLPVFNGLIGPMRDISSIRYEDQKTNDMLSLEEAKSSKMTKSELKAKIKEMIMAEANLDEAKKKKEDEEVNVDDDNITIDPTPEETPAVATDKVDANVKTVQDALTQAQAAAEKLGDKKLLSQIGNTITFFTRAHIVEPGKGGAENLAEVLYKDTIERMEGLVNMTDLAVLETKLRSVVSDWMQEGYEKEEILDYIKYLINKI